MKEDPISQMYKCRSFKVTQTKKKNTYEKKNHISAFKTFL